MPTINAANKTILFGAMKKYKLRKVREVQLVRFGERFMTQLAIGFLAFLRVDGNLVDAGTHPIRVLQQSST
jgi:HK97 family phage major capsid protein